jgi:UDP-2-acetamido-2,6-beta-L-arabino-hexul-4-ose reductase
MRVAITGPNGFLGQHLRFALFPLSSEFETLLLDRHVLEEGGAKLLDPLKKCDALVHLAGMNRGEDNEIYLTNVGLAEQVVNACDRVNTKPTIIFSSSTQIAKSNIYGKSKKKAMEIFRTWGRRNGAIVTNLVIPNIFGEFGRPFYNSAVATFCHQIVRGENSEVNPTAVVTLVYAQEVAKLILELLREPRNQDIPVPGREIKIAEVYDTLVSFKKDYFNNVVPEMNDSFECALFNTFRSHLPNDFYPRYLDPKRDVRGALFEVVKERTGGHTFFSFTKPGFTRGEHYHTRKFERFCVIQGKAEIKLRKLLSNEVNSFIVEGSRPSFIDIPTFYTHNITNIGDTDLLTLFWANEIFNPADPDTYPEKV